MGTTMQHTAESRHRELPDIRPTMTKAEIRKPDIWREQVGTAIQRAMSLRGWSLKEFAGAVGHDERQCSRWIKGAERAQFDALFAVESFRQPLIVALAEIAGNDVDVQTVVTFRTRRTA